MSCLLCLLCLPCCCYGLLQYQASAKKDSSWLPTYPVSSETDQQGLLKKQFPRSQRSALPTRQRPKLEESESGTSDEWLVGAGYSWSRPEISTILRTNSTAVHPHPHLVTHRR
ncbi:hypothetical protein BJ170DRAFT_57195 [Xylariales sp. AK1849]|nr:hypothetical protein BJ170DRAFT_57195 [Xylariales sp. AK1849]